jgi:hypothetical protein
VFPRRAGVAQLVEQLIRNQQVTRSSRVAGSISLNENLKVACDAGNTGLWLPHGDHAESASATLSTCCGRCNRGTG